MISTTWNGILCTTRQVRPEREYGTNTRPGKKTGGDKRQGQEHGEERIRQEYGESTERRGRNTERIRREYRTNTRTGKKTRGDKARKEGQEDKRTQGHRNEHGENTAGIRREYGENTAGIRREYGGNTEGVRREYGRNTAGILKEYGENTERIRQEYGGSTAGIRKEYGENTERIWKIEYGRNTRKEDRRIQPGKKTGGDKARKEYGEKTIWNINHWYFSKNMIQRSAKLPSRTSRKEDRRRQGQERIRREDDMKHKSLVFFQKYDTKISLLEHLGKKTGGDKARKEYGEKTIWNINHWYFSKSMIQRSAKLPSRTSRKEDRRRQGQERIRREDDMKHKSLVFFQKYDTKISQTAFSNI